MRDSNRYIKYRTAFRYKVLKKLFERKPEISFPMYQFITSFSIQQLKNFQYTQNV